MYTLDSPSVVVRDVARYYRADNKRSIFRRPQLSNEREGDFVRALDGVSMYAKKGECIGILGRNGSGKSTLMRLIAGNEAPDEGEVLLSSTPTLLNVSAALQPRLPGRTNIRLGLLAQGVDQDQIENLTDEIIDFAEIGKAVDRPMKTYSSGMGARLKFAISTAVQRDLLYSKWTARMARKNFESAEELICGVKNAYKKPTILFDSQVSKWLN